MSLAEVIRGDFLAIAPQPTHRFRWTGEFGGGDEAPIEPPVDSKSLYLTSARPPAILWHSSNYGRILHFFRSMELHRRQRVLDRWRRVSIPDGPDTEEILNEMARLASRISPQPPDELVAALKQWLLIAVPHHSELPQAEAVLETFDGFVDQIEGDTAYVTLKSREYGDVQDGEYPASQLRGRGIEEQSPFLCKTVKVNGAIRIDIEPIPSVKVTDEHLRRIDEEIEKVLPRDDPGIEY